MRNFKKAYIERNTKSRSNLLIIAEHAGNEIPLEFSNLGLSDYDRGRHISYDIGVLGVCKLLSMKINDHIIMSKYSRLLVDLSIKISKFYSHIHSNRVMSNIDLPFL